MMNKTRWTIGLSALVILIVLGTGWALEKGSQQRSPARRGRSQRAREGERRVTAPSSQEPKDEQPAATDASQEYDRSDLILSQG